MFHNRFHSIDRRSFAAVIATAFPCLLLACNSESPISPNAEDSVSTSENVTQNESNEQIIDSADMYLTSHVPKSVDVFTEMPFASLVSADVFAARAVHPRVSSQELSIEEIECLIKTLSSVVVRTPFKDVTNEWGNPSFGRGLVDGTLWFEIEFVTGEHWLLEVHSTYMGSAHDGVIYVGEYEIGITEDIYMLLSVLFANFEAAQSEEIAEQVKPFGDVTRSDVAKVEYSYFGRWELLDEVTSQELIDLLNEVTVNPSSGTNVLPILYGGGETFRQFRLTFKDGSVNTVGDGYLFCIDDIMYDSPSEGRAVDALYRSWAGDGY